MSVLGVLTDAVKAVNKGLTLPELAKYPTLCKLVTSNQLTATDAAKIIKEIKEA